MSNPFAPFGSGRASPDRAKAERSAVVPIPPEAPARPSRHPQLGAPSATWTYLDAAGAPIGYVNRFDPPAGKEFRPLVLFRDASGTLSWRWEGWPAPRPLYGLDRLAAAPEAEVVVCEGEKAADAAARLLSGHVAVASPNGSKSAGKADWSPLAGRAVTIWPDADEPGAAYATAVAKLVRQAGAVSVRVLQPPSGSAEGWDAADALAAEMTRNDALTLVRAAVETDAPDRRPDRPAGASTASSARAGGSRKRVPQRDSLMGLTTLCDLWHGPDGESYVTFPVGGHRESWPVRSASFKRWLSARAYEAMDLVPGNQAIEDALRVLEARATNEGQERTPWMRSGMEGGRLYLDLCDKQWRAVEITGRDWRVLERHTLPFVRSSAMRPLPAPEPGGMIEELRRFVNVAGDDDFTLVVAWLLAALRDRGPYPILVVGGEQGSGKSTFSKLIRSLVDPNAAPIRSPPKDERDLIVAACNAHVICYDNLSHVSNELADGLCRLATGGGFSTRRLHTDADEMVFNGQRPAILNGIPSLTDRADLADRSVTIRLRAIAEEDRRLEHQFWAEWEPVAPIVLGALCTALSTALRKLPDVRIDRLPRLADFAFWATAAEPGLGWEDGAFMAAYTTNRRAVVDNAFEAAPVAVAIRHLMDAPANHQGWNGTPTELLAVLGDFATEAVKRSRVWPQTPQSLSNAIERAATILRSKGLGYERRHSGNRTITIYPLAA